MGKLIIIIMDFISSFMAFLGNLADRLGNGQVRQYRKYKLEIVYKLITPSYVDTCTCAHMILNIYHICLLNQRFFYKHIYILPVYNMYKD